MSIVDKTLSIYDFGKICRTCLEEGDMRPLYDTCSNEVCLIEMLMSCTFIQFRENDGLPVQICLNCIKEINQAYTFAKKCEKSEALLTKCISQFQNKLRKNSKNDNSHIRKSKTNAPHQTEITNVEIKINETLNINNEQLNKCTAITTVDIKDENKTETVNNIELTNIKNERSKFDFNDLSDTNENFDNDDEIFVNKNEFINDKTEQNSVEIKSENLDVENCQVPFKKRVNKLHKLKSRPPYECKKCFEKFPNFQLLKLHREEKQHPRNSYNRKLCKICNKSVGYSRMNQHMRIHTLEKPYCCEICGARFSISSNLRRHTVSRHSNDKPYKCETCGKGFTRLGLLKDHERLHTGEKPFVCNFCGKSFARSAAFRTHLFVHAKSGETSDQISATEHQCTDCERCFATKAQLKAHMLIHGEKKFLCSDCGRGFVSMILLKSHSKVHSGVRPYSCQVCGKSFSHIGSLKSHNLIHTGQKPFVCSVCNRAFTQRNHLKYHMRTHSGERPYICSVCGKTFALNGNLTVHMRTHTGETPFVCSICGKGFHDSSSMKKHKKGHTTQNNTSTTAVDTIIGI